MALLTRTNLTAAQQREILTKGRESIAVNTLDQSRRLRLLSEGYVSSGAEDIAHEDVLAIQQLTLAQTTLTPQQQGIIALLGGANIPTATPTTTPAVSGEVKPPLGLGEEIMVFVNANWLWLLILLIIIALIIIAWS